MNTERKIKWILIIVWAVAAITFLISLAQIATAADSGYVIFYARGVTVQDPYIYVSNDDKVFANLSWLPDHSETVPDLVLDNPGMLLIRLQPDGFSDTLHMAAGNYTAYMRQSNADQPEEQRFVIGEGISRVVFLGAAYASGDEGCCACHNVTVTDVPGHTIHHDAVTHIIAHPPGIEVVVVVDSPAWTETIFHPAVVRQECHPEVNITQKQMWYYTHSKGWEITTHWRNGVCPVFETIFPRRCQERIVVIEKAYCDSIVEQEGYTETIHHPEVNHTETRPVGEPWYEIVVDAPAWDEQVGAVSHEERICGQKLVCPCGCVRSK